MADIPPAVLRDLNRGRIETVTLVEWLAIDPAKLMAAAAEETGLGARRRELVSETREIAKLGIGARTSAAGALLHRTLAGERARRSIEEKLAAHRSDMVRAWACYMIAADPALPLDERLERTRRFAADPNMAVRECAWASFRPYLLPDLAGSIRLLERWVADENFAIRRCAVEGTRPRGVWCSHIDALKRDPSAAAVLLEPVRSDPTDYVRRAVANWLNDASKTRPDWVVDLCERWSRESDTPETRWIVNRGLRTLRKAKH